MKPFRLLFAVLGIIVISSLAAACHRTQTVQRGYRGLAMEERFSESYLRKEDTINKLSKPLPPAKTTGPTAGETYENVHVLGDLSKSQFARVMLSIKTWVSPDVGCNYCHAAPIYAADDKYTKRVARKMIEMTRHINTDWKQHVGATGVTCYTCHRGNPVPAKLWYSSPTAHDGLLQHRAELRPPEMTAANTTLPADALTDYLLHAHARHVRLARRELHLLSQHPRVCRLGLEPAAACDRLVWNPHGPGPEQHGDVAVGERTTARATRSQRRRAQDLLCHLPSGVE
jgi:photosynthetic reaction center cytochrome c subunit